MVTKKMQCYVKSVKTDADSILTKLKPAIISFLIKFSILTGIVFAFSILLTIIVYGEPYIKSAFEAISNLLEVMLSQVCVTQYNAYLVIMILVDLIIFWGIRVIMMDGGYEYEDPDDRSPYSQTAGSILFLFALFAFNGLLVMLSWDSTTPERVVGWSFMLSETIINMIVVVAGILLYRAYLKCEGKIVPAKPSDWDSLDRETPAE